MALLPIRKFTFLFGVQQPVLRSGLSGFDAITHSTHTTFRLSPFLSYQPYSSIPRTENTIKCFYVREKLFGVKQSVLPLSQVQHQTRYLRDKSFSLADRLCVLSLLKRFISASPTLNMSFVILIVS